MKRQWTCVSTPTCSMPNVAIALPAALAAAILAIGLCACGGSDRADEADPRDVVPPKDVTRIHALDAPGRDPICPKDDVTCSLNVYNENP